jgi:type II secretory pathway component PulJ
MSIQKSTGQTLVEILVALSVLEIVVLTAIEAFGMVFAAELKIQERARKAFYAEWWFNKLESPVSQAEVDAAPRTDEYGRMRFEWDTASGDYGTFRVTLRVLNGSGADVPFTMSRVY